MLSREKGGKASAHYQSLLQDGGVSTCVPRYFLAAVPLPYQPVCFHLSFTLNKSYQYVEQF
jgi:hypothetical protein